jgi:hypothetical protein
MTTRKYSSRSQQSTLAAGITDTATSCTVVSGSALLGGATVPAGTTFTVVIDPDTALEEIVDVTAVSTNVLTITRGVENAGTGQAHSAGAAVRHMAIGRDFREANLHIEATGAYNDGTGTHTMHGIASGEGVVVGTDKTQTLTAKTLTSPIITNPSISGAGVDASIIFEGATADAHETTLTVEEPTADRTITLPNATGTVVLAAVAQTLTNKTMGDALNAGGFKITNLATPTLASDAVRKDFADAQVAAAATSAASAATSATSAAASATTAANSVATIAGYATSSANSATAAATSATSAAASATAAATSATSAAASAVTAATSATAAATSAASAAVSATAASTSATSAAASATAAATSATSAAASATASANSASASATSATASASSASAAATSASSAATSATSAAADATSAAASWDSFDDRYLGPKSSAPTVDNDGNPLTGGVLYYNTTSGVMFVYNGTTSAWEQVAVSTSGLPTLAANNTFTGTNTFNNDVVIAESGSGNALRITNTGTGNSFVVEDETNPDATAFIIGADGLILAGSSTAYNSVGAYQPGVSNFGQSGTIGQYRYSADNAGTELTFNKSRSATLGTQSAVTTNDALSILRFAGSDGTSFTDATRIIGAVDGTVSTGVVPGRIVFSTASSAGTLTERMRIDSAGQVGIGSTPVSGRNLVIGKILTGSTVAYSMLVNNQIQSDVTSSVQIYRSAVSTAAAAFTLTSMAHFVAVGATVGASSAITDQIGFAVDSTLTTAANNYGFYSSIASASSRWNFYANGTAANFFAGRTGIGATLTSGAMAQVTNTTAGDVGFIVKGAASQTGDLLQVQNSAATELFTIDSAGNVGIGTASPATKLHLTVAPSASTDSGMRVTDGTRIIQTNITGSAYTYIGIGASETMLYSTGNPLNIVSDGQPIKFIAGTAERMRIDASGNVGIGVNGPLADLHIGSSTTVSDFRMSNSAATTVLNLYTASNDISFQNATATGGLNIGTNSTDRITISAAGNTAILAVADATTATAARGGGYMGIPASAAAGSGAYAVVAADAGEHIYTTTTRTVTIPANSSVAFPVGTVLSFISGVGAVTTIAITTDTMYLAGVGTTGSRTLAAHGMATAVKVASTTWYISGNGLT